MRKTSSDSRLGVREKLKTTPIRVPLWKSAILKELGEPKNLSERGIFFGTDSVMPLGTVVEILLKMPEMIGRRRMALLRHVVRVEPCASARGHFGVGVPFDCHQASQSDRGWFELSVGNIPSS